MTEAYSKHKERDPQATVDAIRGILGRVGLETELSWGARSVKGLYSNYVTIEGTTLSACGKGTTEAYASASGYAELMERIQNGILVLYPPDGPDARTAHGYLAAPDERYTTAQRIVARHDQALEAWFDSLGIVTNADCIALLKILPELRYDCGDGTVAEIPFADPVGGEVVWLPAALISYTCGSNGMAAGNTAEEALVQGFSEVLERFVARKVLRGEVVPPRIPLRALANAGVADLIARVERGGRLKVHVYDVSLGRGYPVVMTTVADRQRSALAVKFGAHPSLPIAIERTLTETFQYRSIQQATSMNRLTSAREAASLANVTSVFTSGFGCFPRAPFAGKPEWDFAPWPSWEGASNKEMLASLLAVLARDGFRPLVRDVSHLGFPSFQIVVPGMSDVFAPDAGLYESLIAKRNAKKALDRFPQLSPEEQGHFLGLKPLDLALSQPSMFGPPIQDGRMHPCRVFGFLHLALRGYDEACECFEIFSSLTGEMGHRYWQAMAEYARCRNEGLVHKEALRIMRLLSLPDVVQLVEQETADATKDLSRLFPHINCPDCERCELLARGGCAGLLGTHDAYGKIARSMRITTVSQEALLALLQGMV
ncbi:MAG: YcaO-like family protein [Atopobiaceae bacterium]|nr:YcaO-like family protein [Atopobiaceae bacterium]